MKCRPIFGSWRYLDTQVCEVKTIQVDDVLLKSVKLQQELGQSTVGPVKIQVEQIAAQNPTQNDKFTL